MKKIYVIHENDEWLIPLRKSFEKPREILIKLNKTKKKHKNVDSY